jgi:hypothetical protein
MEPHGNSHFDVIIYDQLQAPILWTERNPDKSVAGRSRIIPAQFVRAVVEVKSQLSTETARQAFQKLAELRPLMTSVDPPGDRYPKFLPKDVVLAMVFVEVLSKNRLQVNALHELSAAYDLNRGFYGAMLLSGEGLDPDFTGLTKVLRCEAGATPITSGGDLLSLCCMANWRAEREGNLAVMLTWLDMNFATFAFDLLAIMQGTYERGRVSSFFNLDMTKYSV